MRSNAPIDSSAPARPTAREGWIAGAQIVAMAGATAVAGMAMLNMATTGHLYESAMQRMQSDPTCVKVAQQVEESFYQLLTPGLGGMLEVSERSLVTARADYRCGAASSARMESVLQTRDLRGVTYENGRALEEPRPGAEPPSIDLFNWRSKKGAQARPSEPSSRAPGMKG